MSPQWIAVVGSGGKTSLLYALGRSLAKEGRRVLLTATTHLAMETPPDIPVYVQKDGNGMEQPQPGQLLLWAIPNGTGRRVGPPMEELERVAPWFDVILCEADGSRRLPLKWHASHEPCLPQATQMIFYVVGLSGLGKPAGEVLHRWEQSPYAKDYPMEPEDVLALIRRGLEHMKTNVPVQVVLNQADEPIRREQGMWLAQQLKALDICAQVCAIQKEEYPIVDIDSWSR